MLRGVVVVPAGYLLIRCCIEIPAVRSQHVRARGGVWQKGMWVMEAGIGPRGAPATNPQLYPWFHDKRCEHFGKCWFCNAPYKKQGFMPQGIRSVWPDPNFFLLGEFVWHCILFLLYLKHGIVLIR